MAKPTNADEARELLSKQKKSRLPKFLKGASLPDLDWSDGLGLDDDDIGRLIGILRNEGPGEESKEAREIAAFLDPKSADAWSQKVHDTWGAGGPAAHKWALFQMKVLAKDSTLAKLSKLHDWSSMASSGGSVRAQWYMEVFSRSASKQGAKALYDILAAKIHGGLHSAARQHLESYATREKLDVDAYLEREGILGEVPSTKLPFKPGKDKVKVGDESWVVTLHRGDLYFLTEETHKRAEHLPEDTDAKTRKKVEGWRDKVAGESLRWCGYFMSIADREHSKTFETIEKTIMSDVLGAQLMAMLVWRDGDGNTMRITSEGAFDSDYEAVEVDQKTELSLCLLGDLDKAVGEKWTEHMTDEEIVMPVDFLSRQLYLDTFTQLNEAKDVLDDNLHDRIYDAGFSHGPAEDAGMIFWSYKTFPKYNTRAYISHTPYSVVDGEIYDTEEHFESMRFENLLGESLAPAKVHIPVLAECSIMLAKARGLPTPNLFQVPEG